MVGVYPFQFSPPAFCLRTVQNSRAVASIVLNEKSLPQGDDIAPIPGTKRVTRVEENTAADQLELSPAQIERLNNLTPAAGERHDEGNMAVIDR
jgi:hypothetical protein